MNWCLNLNFRIVRAAALALLVTAATTTRADEHPPFNVLILTDFAICVPVII